MVLIDLPKIGLGTAQMDRKTAEFAVGKALELGYRLIDTAQLYGNEQAVGAAIKTSGVQRDEIILATKLGTFATSATSVPKATAVSLKKLQTDYVDLLYVHWPLMTYKPAKTLPAMSKLVEEEKVRYVCASNFPVKYLEVAIAVCPKAIAANQVEHHPLLPQLTLREYMPAHDITLVAYSPLGRGNLNAVPELTQIAKKHEVSVGQVTLAWEISHGAVPIPKASSESHLKDNLAAVDLTLDAEDISQIDAIKTRKRFINFPIFHPKWDP